MSPSHKLQCQQILTAVLYLHDEPFTQTAVPANIDGSTVSTWWALHTNCSASHTPVLSHPPTLKHRLKQFCDNAALWYPSSRVRTRPKPSNFSGEKIQSMPSFGGEVKPSVPCRSFTACKRTLQWRGSRICYAKFDRSFLVHIFSFHW
jgi:hypothetical protein